ncbi:hypothetical protein SARC_01641 [Sphaeroforma arctica JP610]|uniref:Uncharacterized protein n=1 Tax=Sphaeroforma arctica JP610 TaxID=667725 RepID=A0A0L0GBC4_9EUKA|nr:hypothetical protein SARC_01641 [Sphaeroforma arctica JP610]KNC86204.1 hypothetical protein SARC_01641 [Sphaeroforma arctica JP610]|eukprot:XP_014160106.1 hypothetical protein SARC_01641 [Sphaeroforma arctica JP610]
MDANTVDPKTIQTSLPAINAQLQRNISTRHLSLLTQRNSSTRQLCSSVEAIKTRKKAYQKHVYEPLEFSRVKYLLSVENRHMYRFVNGTPCKAIESNTVNIKTRTVADLEQLKTAAPQLLPVGNFIDVREDEDNELEVKNTIWLGFFARLQTKSDKICITKSRGYDDGFLIRRSGLKNALGRVVRSFY